MTPDLAACSIQKVWRGYHVRSGPPLHTRSLEEEFCDFCLIPIDIYRKVNFPDYLVPNEGNPLDALAHVATLSKRGVIVSTGTERSFFDLILAASCRCEGLVVRDINPRVKAYVDFVVLLLRISEDDVEFRALSEGLYVHDSRLEEVKESPIFSPVCKQSATSINQGFTKRLALIQRKMESSPMPGSVKSYYDRHLEDFAKVYFSLDSQWKSWHERPQSADAFRGVMYYRDKRPFFTLQKYARAGNIIATVGDIGDVRDLLRRRVSLIDVSNISDYTLIDVLGFTSPVVMWTERPSVTKTQYYSCIYSPILEAEDRAEMVRLMDILQETGKIQNNDTLGLQISGIIKELQYADGIQGVQPVLPSYSLEVLGFLREYVKRYVRHIPSLGWVCFNGRYIGRLNTLDEKGVEQMMRIPEIQQDEIIQRCFRDNDIYLDWKIKQLFCASSP